MPSIDELTRFVDDVEATVAFYEEVLGTEPVESWPGGAVFDAGGLTLLVHETYDAGGGDLPPDDHVAVGVADVDESFERLADAGLEVEREPADYDWGRSAYLRDPEGNQVELHEG